MKKLCITIKDWPIAEAEFNRVGLEVEPFQAIVEENRVLGFNKSVYECMKLAKGQDLLLFEDDVLFDGNINFNFPEDALTVHLGCNIIGMNGTEWAMPTNGTPKGFARLHNCWQTHANWYSKQCVEFILKNFNPNICDANNPIFDEWLRVNVLSKGRSYVANPMVAYQRPRWSDIWNRESDYTSVHYRGNEWLKKNL